MPLQLQLTFNIDWLECPKDSPKYWGIFPCIGGDWVLAFVRLAPFVIIILLDTSLFYQVGLVFITLSCAMPYYTWVRSLRPNPGLLLYTSLSYSVGPALSAPCPVLPWLARHSCGRHTAHAALLQMHPAAEMLAVSRGSVTKRNLWLVGAALYSTVHARATR